jgi:hypothetical protein
MSKHRINIWSWHGLSWSGLRARDKANDINTSAWCFFWVISLVAAALIAKFGPLPRWAGVTLILLTLLPAWKFVATFRKMLAEADEMIRSVQLEALAIGYGSGFVVGLTLVFLTPPGPWWFLGIFLPMVIGYVVRIVIAAQASESNAE